MNASPATAEPPAHAVPESPPAPDASAVRKRRITIGIVGGLAFVAIAGGTIRYVAGIGVESTDDAVIEGDSIAVAPRIGGHIVSLHAADNQRVAEGDLLCVIDPRDYQLRVDQERASLEATRAQLAAAQRSAAALKRTAFSGIDEARAGVLAAESGLGMTKNRFRQEEAQVASAEAAVDEARVAVTAAKAESSRAAADLQRQMAVDARATSQQVIDLADAAAVSAGARLDAARSHVTSLEASLAERRAAVETARDAVKQADAVLAEARAREQSAAAAPDQVGAAEAKVDELTGSVRQHEAFLAAAELDLSRTRVTAPKAGRVTRRAVSEGTLVTTGQPLMAVVPSDVWVVANFKETQLDGITPGKPVRIEVDAYPGHELKAHVDSIQSGTGSRFSLLPPENATGNYVKLVQRIPVKIVLDSPIPDDMTLVPGMSVIPTVRTR